MEWTEETVARLQELWNQGLSTAEIGRLLNTTKNAVVGKAHRLGLPARPSPIRRGKAAEAAPPKKAAEEASRTEKPARAKRVKEPAVKPAEKAEKAPPAKAPPVASAESASAAAAPPPEVKKPEPAAPPAVVEAPAPKRVASTPASPAAPPPPRPARAKGLDPEASLRRGRTKCCWPFGDPGTKEFHFCGAEPLPGKPYCAEHAQIAYVKLRDRRDNVA